MFGKQKVFPVPQSLKNLNIASQQDFYNTASNLRQSKSIKTGFKSRSILTHDDQGREYLHATGTEGQQTWNSIK